MLLRQGGDMDETNAGRCACKMVEQEIEGVVADKSAGTVGDGGRNSRIADGLRHGGHGNGGKIGGRAVLCHILACRLIACVIRDSGIAYIDGNTLRGYGIPSGSYTDAKDHIRAEVLRGGQNFLRGLAENGGQQALL